VFYKVDTAEPFVIGTTALSFSVLSFGGSGDVEAGAGSLADRVAFWSDTTTITGDAGLTYTTSPDTLTVDGTIVTDDITAVGAGGVNIENSTPTLWIDDTDTGVSDETTWSVRADQGTFYISTVDDARTGQTSALIMTRSGTDPVAATFNGMDLTVTSGELRVASTQPDFVLEETDQATDEGEYYMRASGGALRIGAQADSGSRPTGGVFLEFDRTGTNADIVKLYADELNGNGQEFVDFKYRDHLGAVKTNAISSGVYSINYAIDGAFYTVELTENITSWSVSIPSNISSIPGYIEIILRIYQDTTGGRTVSWSGWSTASVLGGSLRWANGTAPTLSTAATTGPLKDRIMDIITMKSFDGGIVWYGDYSVGYDTV
jgi:hypothetical protein